MAVSRYTLICFGVGFFGLWSSLPMAAVYPQQELTFMVGNNRVVSMVGVSGDKMVVERRYQKPYEGGTRKTSFRMQDRSIYRLDCGRVLVGLLRFSVLRPVAKRVYETSRPVWLRPTGVEFRWAFQTACGVEVKPEPLMHPDDWLKLGGDSALWASKKPESDAMAGFRAVGGARLTASREIKAELIPTQDLNPFLSDDRYRLAEVVIHYDSPMRLPGQAILVSRVEEQVAFDCQSAKAMILSARFYDQDLHLIHQRRYLITFGNQEALWFAVPESGQLFKHYQTGCMGRS